VDPTHHAAKERVSAMMASTVTVKAAQISTNADLTTVDANLALLALTQMAATTVSATTTHKKTGKTVVKSIPTDRAKLTLKASTYVAVTAAMKETEQKATVQISTSAPTRTQTLAVLMKHVKIPKVRTLVTQLVLNVKIMMIVETMRNVLTESANVTVALKITKATDLSVPK
jgi:hypothetical protein